MSQRRLDSPYLDKFFIYIFPPNLYWNRLDVWKCENSHWPPCYFLILTISESFDTVAFVRILWCSCRVSQLNAFCSVYDGWLMISGLWVLISQIIFLIWKLLYHLIQRESHFYQLILTDMDSHRRTLSPETAKYSKRMEFQSGTISEILSYLMDSCKDGSYLDHIVRASKSMIIIVLHSLRKPDKTKSLVSHDY